MFTLPAEMRITDDRAKESAEYTWYGRAAIRRTKSNRFTRCKHRGDAISNHLRNNTRVGT